MRLADFISANIESILLEWVAFAREILPGSQMDISAVSDHAEEILLATVRDMQLMQSSPERSAKSKGRRSGDTDDGLLNDASEQHALGRLGSGFNLLEVVSEYRALRASVLRLWGDSGHEPCLRNVDDVTRFNESIDQSLTRAVSSYTKRVDQSRDLFLAILSHDLRNPLNSISMSAELLQLELEPEPDAIEAVLQIAVNASVMGRMIGDLLDYTRTRLGAGMPVNPSYMDMASLCKELFNEFKTANPSRDIRFHSTGNLKGHWDTDRLRQALSNLLGNAIQHSPPSAAIELSATDDGPGILLVVHNEGATILPGEMSRIFEPLVRGASAEHPSANRPGSIGLGLYIAREIAKSHGGSIEVTSSENDGTAFTLRLPREAIVGSGQPILDEEHLQTM